MRYLVFLTIIFFKTASGVTIHLKPGPTIGKDSYLSSDAPNTNFGNHQEFSGDAWTCGGSPCFGRGLLQFDLNIIPIGAIITSARISLFANTSPANGGGIAMQGNNESVLSRVTSTWSENTVKWNLQPSYTSLNAVTLPQSTSAFQDYLNVDVKSLVQDMVNDPSNSFGFLLKLTNEVYYSTMIFASSDYPDSTKWPEITIEYLTPICLDISIDDNGKDAFLASDAPSTNYGLHQELSASAWTCSGNPCFSHGLFSFDLTAIPQNALVSLATLDLYANPNPSNGNGIAMQGNNASFLRRITSPWLENSVTWNTEPSTTNVNEVVLPQSTSGFQNYLNVEVTQLVKDMINDPTNSYGFLVKLQIENYYTSMIFASKDYPNVNNHAILKVCYVLSTSINEISKNVNNVSVFPNPFDQSLGISLNLNNSASVKVDLMDIYGRSILSESKGFLNAGIHEMSINSNIENLADALYLMKIQANDDIIIKKVIKN